MVAVAYAWHPWAGRLVHVHEVIERTTGASARCGLVDAAADRVQEIPVWMLDAALCRSMRASTEPVTALPALRDTAVPSIGGNEAHIGRVIA